MKALSTTVVGCNELPEALEFNVTGERGWIELALGPTIGLAIFLLGVFFGKIVLIFFGFVAAGGSLFRWAQPNETVFRVYEWRLFASRNLGGFSPRDLALAVPDVRCIGWSLGGRNSPKGLYVWYGMAGRQRVCVLPEISEKQAKSVTERIAARYSSYKIERGPLVSFSVEVG
jgi:hypothetical protein